MPKPLHEFYSFPVYSSREDYRAKTAKEAPPWDPNKPLKAWEDPAPTNTEFDEIMGEFCTYKPVLSILPNGENRIGADGQPVTGSIRLPIEIAKTVNLLPAGGRVPVAGEIVEGHTITAANVATASRDVPVPLNLPAGSRLIFARTIGSDPVVLLPGEEMPGAVAAVGGFTESDRALLQRIATKVGA